MLALCQYLYCEAWVEEGWFSCGFRQKQVVIRVVQQMRQSVMAAMVLQVTKMLVVLISCSTDIVTFYNYIR